MDLSYLHALQDLREALPGFVEQLFALLSFIGDGPGLVAIVFVVYWCVDKRAGLFAFMAFAGGNLVSQLVKNTVCAYRPWIKDPTIVPAESAMEEAAGYSFPSAHTCGTATSLGSFAWLARRKHKAVTVVCALVVLLMGFSRNFLGVHTPQDVIVGLVVAIAAIAAMHLFFNWIDRYDAMLPGHNKDIVVTVAVWVVCAISLAVVVLKPYPMDYVDGALLVDPVTMQKGSFEAVGICMGLSLAWVLERRLVAFGTQGLDMRGRAVRFVVGVVIVGASYVATDVLFKALLPYNVAKLLAMAVVSAMGVFVAPLAFNKIEKRSQ